ncbi:hypothetical protein SODALDRAFT_154939 [Sodiomyces alkalinus F11]|uniref:PH domain-containing protein n=1 Tax=Sodiomyces alkalinus (strain CBS 110278 / VKM F-3762 / F11) TaxID=1314773 RepID=A0A3N2PXT7_SODAK|nr:hypothetical protein SODALDRAFT_154939 [Sodiomyces alkalinus F11]ROT39226.1 hypothetical protein SODALDRAFT_154939 [Sodiomyces alkalinus F11]
MLQAAAMKSTQQPLNYIQAGGGGVVPQTDAPTSASNAGERRVTIRCFQSSISLPVTPDTSPVDLLYSSANLMTHQFDPQTSIVVECYFAFGLERRLRRYERIRDVLNSWERDSQHSLLIIPDAPTDRNADLTIELVPRSDDPPPGFSNFALQHCQRPGRWNKRLVTLLNTGQVFTHKKPDAKPSDKDSTLLCNLSDFDVYQVTEEDMLNHIRPPKTHVFAVKSQQKNSVFLNTENFIHFFSTDDDAVARNVQSGIHSWRSWYLVNRKVDLGRKERAQQMNGDTPAAHKTVGIVKSGHHRLKVSVDETPYTIGTFSPLLDLDRFDKPMEEFGKDFLPETGGNPNPTSQPLVHRAKTNPGNSRTPVEVVTPATSITTLPVPPKSPESSAERVAAFAKDNEFKTSGLLGKAYEDRKLHTEWNSGDEPSSGGPFTGGLLQHHQELGRQATTRWPERSYTPRGSASPPMKQPNAIPTCIPLDQPPLQGPFTGGLLQQHAIDQQNRRPGRSNTTTRRPPTSSAVAQPSATSATSTMRPLTRSMTVSSRPTTSDSASYAKQRDKPGPLLDVAPKVPEISSYWRSGHGHGVRAPTGLPLISMATDTRPGFQQPSGMVPGMISPPMSPPLAGLARRATTKTTQSAKPAKSTQMTPALSAGAPLPRASPSRPRSQSTTTKAAAAAGRRYVSHEKPPSVPVVPPIPLRTPPVRSSRRNDDEDVPLINFVDRTRSRDPNSGGRGPDARSRSGTMMG